jgi:MazG family protein
MKELAELLKIMSTLRDPVNGCPWDREQTHASILPFTIEEVYELAEAIQSGNHDAMRDELGDLLFQIVFYCQMSGEAGGFVFRDIVNNINEKLVRRHPHVFGDEKIESAGEQSLSWEKIKSEERRQSSTGDEGLLDSVSRALPSLIHALKLQKKAATVGFDWEQPGPVLDKIEEEVGELREELRLRNDREALTGEVGDLLFACVNFARHAGVDPETALMQTNRKFRTRFAYIETQLSARGKSLEDAGLDEMEALWEEAKKNGC